MQYARQIDNQSPNRLRNTQLREQRLAHGQRRARSDLQRGRGLQGLVR